MSMDAVSPRRLVHVLPVIFAAASLLSLATVQTAATTMTEQQVRNVCGDKLQTGSAGGKSAIGCEKKCGNKLCTYGCVTANGKQTCDGLVVSRASRAGVGGPAGVNSRLAR